ncbi:MAG: DUF393 domain-containing protein [Fimbriimonadales bacterium]
MADPRPTVLFDGECGFCRSSVGLLRGFRNASSVLWLDRNSPEAAILTNGAELPDSLVLLDADGTHSGFEAVWRTARHAGVPWPLLRLILLVPRPIREGGYRWVARNRHRLCLGGSCDASAKPGRRSQR